MVVPDDREMHAWAMQTIASVFEGTQPELLLVNLTPFAFATGSGSRIHGGNNLN